ncbi:MAG: hypothetical protein DRO90_02740 [Candidatus Altiarchaeales archaeon]|nr:MAG: hypothetical protein DRO95_03635 [Candidatus Altiarchaeales archaeon]RLI93820.1 MAG: hypothetical protein DRO94_04355 [Candidatus Altiarchaeales archaeon]RLI93995.1 MAG: hypothetical protein DRO90_02740 [Candidatus Altiarchaeales archaeon]HDO82773.1 hypothetical protein [Candidatus Altiarchaeales archaeon]HEX55422.1 hypothetical protein [Candidatus Altiarchaeales archaeon]
MTKLRKVVLDVLKPHSPDIATLAKKIADIEGIDGVNISVYEIDKEVENVKITVIGKFENLSDIREAISEFGGTIHSMDEVVAGKSIVGEKETLQERHHVVFE